MRKLQLLLPMLLMATISFAQQKIITGHVTSKTNNEALPGVTVANKKTVVLTDASGLFSISAEPGETLEFSYVGMSTTKLRVASGQTELDVALEEGNDLNQVIVTGYKAEKKVDLTGAVSIVSMKNIKNNPVSSPALALQGQVPGVLIQADGSPTGNNGGNSPTIIIRGVNNLRSLGNTNGPLYVIDGVSTTRYEDFSNLNSGSITSIQVLKDASASSIYGSRAANGVIIVTTRDGATNGKVHIALNSSLTQQTMKPWQEPVLSSRDRGVALWQAAVNDKQEPNNNSTSNIYQYDWNGDFSNPVLNDVKINPFVGGDTTEPVGNTNWQNEIYRKALVSATDLAIYGGDGKSGYNIDLGYYNNDGLVIFTKFRRYNARINSHTSAFNNRFRFGENFQFSRTSQVNSNSDVGGAASQDLAFTLAPTIPVRKTNGQYAGPVGAGYSDRNNPVDVQSLGRYNTNNALQGYGNIYAEIEPVKHLVIRTSLGFDYNDLQLKRVRQIGEEGPVLSFNSVQLTQSKEFTFTWTNTIAYNMEFGRSRLNILGGVESVKSDLNLFSAANTNFAIQNPDYYVLDAGSGAQTVTGNATGYRLLSQFGKLFYSFGDKYLASVTVRRDGSSRFGANNPYGVFPAVTLGWRVNNEAFFQNIATAAKISNLKIRAGYGTVGNQQTGDLAAYTLYAANYGTSASTYPDWLNSGTAYDLNAVNTGTLPSGFVQTQRGNPNLKWEETKETDIGLDFGFFQEKIFGSFDYYNRNTDNILIQPPTAGAVGEGQLQYVNGASKNTKGWELLLGFHNQTGSGFSYTITANASRWKDKITALPTSVQGAYPGDPNHPIIGHSQFSIFGYKNLGVFQNQQEVDAAPDQPGKGVGTLHFADLNSDGKVNVLDQEFLGTTLPSLEYGLRIEVGWKGFDLTVFGSGVTGKRGFDNAKQLNSFIDTRNNYGPGVLKAWTPQNPNSNTPALSILNPSGGDRTSDYFFANASYFKLRSIQLGYNLPAKIASTIKMEGLRIYVSGQNLFAVKSKEFLTKDPERVGSLANWPVPTSYTVGINANF